MTSNADLTPTTAQQMLDDADRISRRAHDAVRWPYVTFLLALGTSTSLGTLGMAMTVGDAFGLTYVGTLAAVFGSLIFFLLTTQGRLAFAWSRRWTIYVAAWLAAYVGAIAVVSFAHGSIVLASITSGLVFAVTFTAAALEAKR
ncbi:chemotaxis protein CheY [Frondihabitans sp. PAMC 28766]|uniref:chemotaxis protein CheY n=1 Tax=Frondihabitans sp. PAMC 28766 TaxID=1795630 RepID=UPI00078CA608|nr:chemotaxis protein CheY [Frondihabitans sp. PAMC 28766]AMM21428.1 chemotaxis protein CheY [Frondihabitans sp. PAMC 28766]